MSTPFNSHSHGITSGFPIAPPETTEVVNAKRDGVSGVAWMQHSLVSTRFWLAVGSFGMALQAWDTRHFMNPDGVSYLDMASGTLHGGAHNLINLYWSPLYPSLIALCMFLFHPSPNQENPLIHLLNWLIFVGVTLCFAFLLRSWIVPDVDSSEGERGLPPRAMLVAFAFCMFFWSVIEYVPVSHVNPDLLVAGIVYLAAGICGRLSRPRSGWMPYFALGVTLALGYYAKAAMFPAGLLLLLLLFVWPPSASGNRYRILVAGMVFLMACAPFIAILSNRAGHLTMGESGSLNYLWLVDKEPPYAGLVPMSMTSFILASPNSTKPEGLLHPPRTLAERPLTLDFSTPSGGTYPLWYDPYYWNAGPKTQFNLRKQVAALKENILRYGHAFIDMGSLCAGVLALGMAAFQKRIFPKLDRNWYRLLIWSIGICAMYTFVYVEYRYLAAFFVLFWLAAYGAILGRVGKSVETAILATVLFSLAISSGGAGLLSHYYEHKPADYLVIANGLHSLGVNPGDEVATVGDAFNAYYAHPAGVRIVAEIPDADEFWSSSQENFDNATARLAGIGVKALVAEDGPRRFEFGDWREIPGTRMNRVRVLLLQPLATVSALPEGEGSSVAASHGDGKSQ